MKVSLNDDNEEFSWKNILALRIDLRTRCLATLAFAVGGFSIGTAEFVAMGLQLEMARSSSVDIPTAGQYILLMHWAL